MGMPEQNKFNGVRRTVLVVEDDREINSLVGAYVDLCGFDYLESNTGLHGLESARTRMPSLIILDLMLPDLDGFEVCRRLKAEKATRDIPVIMLTALGDDLSKRRGVNAGAAAYITKPFDPDHLMQSMKEHART